MVPSAATLPEVGAPFVAPFVLATVTHFQKKQKNEKKKKNEEKKKEEKKSQGLRLRFPSVFASSGPLIRSPLRWARKLLI